MSGALKLELPRELFSGCRDRDVSRSGNSGVLFVCRL